MFDFFDLNSMMHFRENISKCLLRGEGGMGWNGGRLERGGGGLVGGQSR